MALREADWIFCQIFAASHVVVWACDLVGNNSHDTPAPDSTDRPTATPDGIVVSVVEPPGVLVTVWMSGPQIAVTITATHIAVIASASQTAGSSNHRPAS